MIQLDKIKYASSPNGLRHNCTDTIGSLVMHCSVTSDNDAPIPANHVKEHIAETIWRMAYGDLHQPLMELQQIARHSVQPQHYDRVMALCDTLNALLDC